MSAKWRALQHRHRYTYSAVIFPQSYKDSLNHLPSHVSSLKFFVELKQLVCLNSIYSQVNHAKNVASAFSQLLSSGDEGLVNEAAKLYVEILFFENSLPLHKTLVSVLVKSRNFEGLIGGCFRRFCDEYGCVERGKGKRFCVSQVASSIMSTPKLGCFVGIVEECSVLVAWNIVLGLNSVVLETSGWSRPSPVVMEQCQEALSCLYYLLQRFPSKFSVLGGCQSVLVNDSNVFEMIVTVILSTLKSMAFSRDCFVAAGVSFCAAIQVCLSPQELGLVIMEGLFSRSSCNSVKGCKSDFEHAILKIPYKGDLFSELNDLSVLSRLCLIRGILTAIPRLVLSTQFVMSSNLLNGFDANGEGGTSIQTILFDAILPELCNYCENPIDSHFNFHALTVMQISLQQVKTLMLANLANLSENYDPIPEEMGTRILRIIWNNLEDPLSQTVKQVHLIFDLFLDIQSNLYWAEDSERFKSFLKKIATDLIRLGPRCKGRYVPLVSLTKRLGAKTLLDMSPDLLFQAVQAFIDDDVCCAATSFLKCFLENLRDECWSSDGVEKGYEIFRRHCLPPFLYGLASGFPKLRSNLNIYALSVLLEVDVDSIFPMLSIISVGQSGADAELAHPELSCTTIVLTVEQKVAILVSLLKVSRLYALIQGDIDFCENSSVPLEVGGLKTGSSDRYAIVYIKGIKFKVLAEWLVMALTHLDDSLRVDAGESLFLNPKTSSLPSHLELSLMRAAVPLNMRCCSTAFQMKWTSLFRKFFSRVRTALERQVKQGIWQPLVYGENNEVYLHMKTQEAAITRAEDLFQFMRWLSCFLFFSCYPSAPYERKIMAMELILIMSDVWSIVPGSQENSASVSSSGCLYPYNQGITLPDSTLLLVGSIIDSWDRLRQCSFRILLHFPTPLPGISSQSMVCELITWAKRLICSPRVRDSDAGALTLRLIFRKYILELGWIVRASVDVFCINAESQLMNGNFQICRSKFPVIEYINSLIDWLHAAVEEGDKDLSEACKNSFVHGVLLTLRYTFEELDWNSGVVLSSIPEMRCALEKLLELVKRITSLALWVVSSDAWYLPEDMDEMIGDDTFLYEVPVEREDSMSSSENQVDGSKFVQDFRSSGQIVMVGCWLAMKEVSLLLGTIIRKVPLPPNTSLELLETTNSSRDAAEMTLSNVVLDLKQLETIGNHFLEVLLKMKHNGAIDKTRAGFIALCNRLLCSNDPRLCKLTESWMEQLMERTVAKGQVVDDLLRRSAGIPAAFTALFLAEPEGTPKKLLPRALRWLIDLANRSLSDLAEASSMNRNSCDILLMKLSGETESLLPHEMNGSERTSKIREEGVIPTVHAFNVLRAAFNDANLATDTSGFSAEAIIVSIRSFSSAYWEVRNSACLAYTALVRRIVGFLNVQKRESARRVITALEFFHRYPSLHSFIFNELRLATQSLSDGLSETSEANWAKVVHPSLCPVLILLSRLKPSTITSEIGDPLDPFLFMQFIRRCSSQSNLRVRILASRALTSLVSNENLPIVLLEIASNLPCMENQKTMVPVSPSSKSTFNGTRLTSFNFIHGTLLQLSTLLNTNCRNLSDFSKKDQILGDLITVLAMRSWLGNPRRCLCPILNASFLSVLDHMLSIVRTCGRSKNVDAICNLILELSTECLDMEASREPSYYDPTIAELRKQAVCSYFSCVFPFQLSKEAAEEVLQMPTFSSPASNLSEKTERAEVENAFARFQQRLIHSMSDVSYEVRLATLKWLFRFLQSTASGSSSDNQPTGEISLVHHWANTDLQDRLLKLLAVEKHHKCTYYILRIFFTWNLLQFQKVENPKDMQTVYVGVMDCDSVLQLWDKLFSMYKLARHSKTQETLICCMGICIKRLACLLTESVLSLQKEKAIGLGKSLEIERCSCLFECITYFVNVIKQHSTSSEPVSMRKAAAESMVASGLLEQTDLIGSYASNNQIPSENSCSHFEPNEAINVYARKLLDVWFTCIKLLEDEDLELRQKLAMDVQKFVISKKSRENYHPGVVPTQVERVIELSFEFLSSIFGNWLEYFDCLLRWVLNAANSVVSRGDFVRRVFDKEIDNNHEEKMCISQMCCYQLEKLLVSESWTVPTLDKLGVGNYLQLWRTRFCHQLMSFAGDYFGKSGGVDWISCAGNQKDYFLPLYINLLGFYVLSKCIINGETSNGTCLLSDIVELGETISPFLRNPLISNLYLVVVDLHEKVAGVPADHLIPKPKGNTTIWDDFDPYFLLR